MGGGGGEKFGLVSDPSRKHSSEGVGLVEGTEQSHCRRPKPVVPLPVLSGPGGAMPPRGTHALMLARLQHSLALVKQAALFEGE